MRTGWKVKCGRCKIDRHDRCIGLADCGCEDEAHADERQGVIMGMDDMAELVDRGLAVAKESDQGYEVGRDNVAVYLDAKLADLLGEAATLQDRDPGVVLRRALDHYLHCGRGRCPHQHDETARQDPPVDA